MAMIEFHNVCFQYPNHFQALENVSFSIEKGSNVAIIGQNGAGKTTTVKMMNGLLKPSGGKVLVDGLDTLNYTTAMLSKKTGYVFQNPGDQIFHGTVREEIEFGPKMLKKSEAEIKMLTEYAAEQTMLQDKLEENPYNLPLSVRKFVCIASVLAMDTDIVVLDEPTAGQDLYGKKILGKILEVLHGKEKTVITITHDMEFVVEYFSRVYVMAHKNLLKAGTPEEIFSDDTLLAESMLKRPFYSELAHALDMDAGIVDQRQFILGLSNTGRQ